MTDDARPFPIQGELRAPEGQNGRSTIPWWLAKIAYKEYSRRYGSDQTLERIAERGGFGRKELLMFLTPESLGRRAAQELLDCMVPKPKMVYGAPGCSELAMQGTQAAPNDYTCERCGLTVPTSHRELHDQTHAYHDKLDQDPEIDPARD